MLSSQLIDDGQQGASTQHLSSHLNWRGSFLLLLLRKRVWQFAFAVAAIVVILLLWLMYDKTLGDSPAVRASVDDKLRSIHQLDSDWNVAIMGSKVGLIDSYDSVVAPLRKITTALRNMDQEEGAADAEIAQSLSAARSIFSGKGDLVNAYTSHNSILRNSLRYLPTAADEAKIAILRFKAPSRGLAMPELSLQIDKTLEDALKYALIPSSEQNERLTALVNQLQNTITALSDTDPSKEMIQIFLSHAGTVLRQVAEESELLSQILKVPTISALEKASTAFDNYFARRSFESEWWRKALFLYAAMLLLLVAYIGWQLRQSYRKIRQMNSALVQANDGLELKVQERTGELVGALASLHESEAQLVQSEKMSSLGQMVAGVAHEINTPLAYVRSNLETVGDQLSEVSDLVRHSNGLLAAISETEPNPDKLAESFAALSALTASFTDYGIVEELRKLTGEGLHGIDQISEIVVNLRNFSRLDRSKITRFDLREGLDSTLVIARNTVKQHQVVKRYESIPAIDCAPSQINQVFLNLITNAAQALPAEGGVITISTISEDDKVKVEIADNGSGIQPEHLSKIFDPFFTTKEIGKGTGLGLSIAYKIIQEHGGEMSVQSTPGLGTTFTIRLPIHSHAAEVMLDELERN